MQKFYSIQEAINAVLLCAANEVGYMEKASAKDLYNKIANAGSSNYTKYGKEMHSVYPSVMDYPAAWCDAFVDWCFYTTFGICNAKKILAGDFNDYTVASANLYKNKKAWHTSNPKAGDQIFFKNSTRIYHTGIVYKVDSKYVYTYEGNTSNGSAIVANGGMVCSKKYTLNNSNIAGYGRPLYELALSTDAPIEKFEIRLANKGLEIIGATELNIRSFPKTGSVVGTLKQREHVYPTSKTFLSNGEVWFYLEDKNAWFSGKYIQGWIYELTSDITNKWWYAHKDYTYTIHQWEYIDGAWYYFDELGYAKQSEWLNWNDEWYYLSKDCYMATKAYIKPKEQNGTYYWVDESGIWHPDSSKPLQKYHIMQ